MKYIYTCIVMVFMFTCSYVNGQSDSTINITLKQRFDLTNYQILKGNSGFFVLTDKEKGLSSLLINGDVVELDFENKKAALPRDLNGLIFIQQTDKNKLYHLSSDSVKEIPLWLSLLPPLLAIILALVFKEVIVSLFIGVWTGALIAGGFNWYSPLSWIDSLFKSISKYIVESLTDSGHISVIVFSLLIGGIVAIISKNGGMAGVVNKLSVYAKSAKSSQFVTWLLGVAIFFDDYANTLIVGNTMRSVTDKFNISREKLAYIVDSTAAPVAAIAFITTWIGAELGYIGDGLAQLDMGLNVTPYAVFLSSLKYSFYPILTLIFILILIYTQKDFGPMYTSETRARTTGQVSPAKTKMEDEPDMEDLSPVPNAPEVWWHAALPICVVIGMTILGLLITGFQSIYSSLAEQNIIVDSWSSAWQNIGALNTESANGFFTKLGYLIGVSDSYQALLWSSLCGVITAIIITVSNRTMNLFETMHWMTTGFKTMLPAIIILTLAWALAICTNEIHTADYLSSALQDSINPYFFTAIIFIMAGLIAFSTGSSWSTMAILYPIAIPTAYAICNASGLGEAISYEIMLSVIATVLGASVLGDHCSPISDTSILSSLASDCNHIDHVRTQLPYALTVGLVSIIGITISILLGGGLLVCFILLTLSTISLYFIVKIFGREIVEPETEH